MKKSLYLYITILILLGCGTNQDNHSTKIIKEETPKIKSEYIRIKAKEYKFVFKSLDNQTIKLKVKNNNYNFENIKQPIVLVNFLATWCPPCIGQIPHLNKLQKKYKEKLFILGTLIYNEELKDKDLENFMASQKINFYISKDINTSVKFGNFIAPKLKLKPQFSLPLMILFVKGKYYTHYEGSIPEEMIESDIKQALNKIKGK